MPTHLLSRRAAQARPALHLHADVSLPLARVHEACGPARIAFALWVAGQTQGPVLWITPIWQAQRLNPTGLLDWLDPARILFAHPRSPDDLLWCMEETLRSGTVPLVVAECPDPPAMTPVRRLHLAAETGSAQGGSALGSAVLGLLLTPGAGGAQGIESRWHMSPLHHPALNRWHLERRRARTQPPMAWEAYQTAPRKALMLRRAGVLGERAAIDG